MTVGCSPLRRIIPTKGEPIMGAVSSRSLTETSESEHSVLLAVGTGDQKATKSPRRRSILVAVTAVVLLGGLLGTWLVTRNRDAASVGWITAVAQRGTLTETVDAS